MRAKYSKGRCDGVGYERHAGLRGSLLVELGRREGRERGKSVTLEFVVIDEKLSFTGSVMWCRRLAGQEAVRLRTYVDTSSLFFFPPHYCCKLYFWWFALWVIGHLLFPLHGYVYDTMYVHQVKVPTPSGTSECADVRDFSSKVWRSCSFCSRQQNSAC